MNHQQLPSTDASRPLRNDSKRKDNLVDGIAWFALMITAVASIAVCFSVCSYSPVLPDDFERRLQEDGEEELSVNITFSDLLQMTIFITVAWLLGNGVTWFGLPTLVGEIMAGFLLGPPLANFCPFPQAMVLIGNFGLIGLMLESGIHLDINQLKETGKRAVVMAISGTTLGLLSGLGMGFLTDDSTFKSSMAVGAAFAPSSLGVAATVLSAGQVLNTPTGQLIVSSSVVDDVLGLILLSILDVFVMDAPTALDFIRPFIASFGYLIVLGYAGIALIPKWIEHWLLPRVPTRHQEKAVFCVLFGLLIVYLPVLNYSGASYLTGAFLAGLSVSQVPSIHTSYARNGRELMVWLMRIFFAATIGFQVPIRKFEEFTVLRWGTKFLVPVLSKIPVGFLVPKFHDKVPNDFPFDPYWRDVWITSLSVLCRGEFNFIVASFALSQGLLGADIYSGIVFAVLLSCIAAPLALSRLIARYNKLSQDYLSKPHAVTRVDKTSSDGYRPLFIAIQIRTPIQIGLHETLQQELEGTGLLFLDHRSWHTNGAHDAVDISEIFAQDTKTRVRVFGCFGKTTKDDGEEKRLMEKAAFQLLDSSGSTNPDAASESGSSSSSSSSSSISNNDTNQQEQDRMSTMSNAGSDRYLESDLCDDASGLVDVNLVSGNDEIEKRLFEIRQVLVKSLEADNPAIRVQQWQPFFSNGGGGGRDDDDNVPLRRTFSFHSQLGSDHHDPSTGGDVMGDDLVGHHGTTNPIAPSPANSTSAQHHHQPNLEEDLWATDTVAHQNIRRHTLTWNPIVGGHLSEETDEENFLYHHNHPPPLSVGAPSSVGGMDEEEAALAAVTEEEEEKETRTIHDRLHGYVRHH